MYTSFHKTKTRKLIYNLKTHKVFVYVTTVMLLALVLRRLWGAGAGAGVLRRHLRHPDNTGTVPANEPLSAALRARLARLNDNCTELGDRGDRAQGDTVIVVQVHRDLVRLQYLIASLARVHGIEDVVLVFSHGHYDERIEELVHGVSFCRVVQIYFPHSSQLNPGAFKSAGAGDVTRRAQHKLHWWWKAHFVFSRVERPEGTVLLLEEHEHVAPDALHVLRYARHALASHPGALVVALGRTHGGGDDYGLLALDEWRPVYGVGLALNRTAWRRIVAGTDRFCLFDDSGWSYSLLNVFEAEAGGAAEAVVAVVPRVAAQRGQAAAAPRSGGAALFPGAVHCVSVWGAAGRLRAVPRVPRGAGEWADARDRRLCLDPLLASATEVATDVVS